MDKEKIISDLAHDLVVEVIDILGIKPHTQVVLKFQFMEIIETHLEKLTKE